MRSLVIPVAIILMSMSAMPCLASSVDAPKYSRGDRWEYDIFGAYNVQGKIRMEVLGATVTNHQGSNIDVYVMSLNRTGGGGPASGTFFLTMDIGKVREEYPGTVITYSPPFRQFVFPLRAGDSCNYQYNRTGPQGNATTTEHVELKIIVEVFEEVTVPAGRFEAFRINVTEVGTSSGFRIWFSERAGNIVKQEYMFGGSLFATWSLVSFEYAKAPAASFDAFPIILIVVCVLVPVIVLIVFRKRVVRSLRPQKKGYVRKSKKSRPKRESPGKSRERFKSTKAYNHKSDKGIP
jgi:hypothetical protein